MFEIDVKRRKENKKISEIYIYKKTLEIYSLSFKSKKASHIMYVTDA